MFGSSPGRYLLDFYHVSEYLHAAENETAALGSDWVKEQENRLLEGDSDGVLKSLKQHLEEQFQGPGKKGLPLSRVTQGSTGLP